MTTAEDLIEQGRKARANHRLAEARDLYSQAAQLLRETDLLRYAHTIRHLADMRQDEANLAEAKPLYEEALEIYRTSLNTKILDLANTVRPYALLLESLGDKDSARELLQEAMGLYRSIRIEEGVKECRQHLLDPAT